MPDITPLARPTDQRSPTQHSRFHGKAQPPQKPISASCPTYATLFPKRLAPESDASLRGHARFPQCVFRRLTVMTTTVCLEGLLPLGNNAVAGRQHRRRAPTCAKCTVSSAAQSSTVMLSVSLPASKAEQEAASRLQTRLLREQLGSPAQAGDKTTSPLPESCRAARFARIAPSALGLAVACKASSVAAALQPAALPASCNPSTL